MINTQLILIIAILSAVSYIITAFLISFEKTAGIGKVLWGVSVLLNGVLVLNNYIINGYVPFVSMYQVLTFLSLTFALTYIYMKYFYDGAWMARYFLIAPAICLTGVCFMGIGSVWTFPPALQSIWFVPHILMYMIAYSLCAIAFIITLISWIDKKDTDRKENGAYLLIKTAFPFLTAGMFFGAIWANDVWCAFWSFDMKENWALVTWLMYTVYLHFRRNAALKKYSKIFAIAGFIAIIITMFFVGAMGGNSRHAYST